MVLAWGSGFRPWSLAAGAGNGFEDLKVEVSSFRPGAPTAGSSLEDLSVEVALPVVVWRL